MGDWQWWLRSQIRRVCELEAPERLLQRTRYFINRHVHSRRRIALILCALLFVFYCLLSSGSKKESTDAENCLEERVRLYASEIDSFAMGRDNDGLFFIGNGYFGVGDNGEVRTTGVKTLSVSTGLRPLVQVEGPTKSRETFITDFAKGKLLKIKCFSLDGECACVTSTSFVHRTRNHILIEDVQITNPTKQSLQVRMSRDPSPLWKAAADSPTSESPLLYRESFGPTAKTFAAVLCSSVPSDFSVASKREESFRFTCAFDVRLQGEETNELVKKATIDSVVSAFSAAKTSQSSLYKEHENAWEKLHESSFHLSTSRASNVLNGNLINSTRYAIVSNLRALLLEETTPPQERMALEAKMARRDLCYTGHSTLLYPSRLWQPAHTAEEVVSLVDTWLLTLEKRGCASLVEAGATGIVVAYVLSLAAASIREGHLEVSIDPSDLHREMYVNGIELNDASRSKVSFQVLLNDENRAMLKVSSASELYMCGGGCEEEPIRVSSTGSLIPVKITKPLTSILYITPTRSHLNQLKNAIHVAHVDEAPAHGEEIIALHKHGASQGGLPTSFWILLGVLLVAFHVFLFKLLYSEWRKGESAPYNPYLRLKYMRNH